MAPTAVEALLHERISQEGPLSFREVMQAALYDPHNGYYTNLRGFGADGDFITSPERHPAFGWLLARQALDVWQALGYPRPFTILELGGGSGALAAPLFDSLSDHIPNIVYTLDEPSPSLRAVQQRRLTHPAFRWEGTDEPHDFILANEVLDALPVHRGIGRGGHLHELRVGLDERGALGWMETPEPSAPLDGYFAALHVAPTEGAIVDVCLELPEFVSELVQRLDGGVALILDYTASPPRDSLLTYYRHTMGSDPLVRLGEQDISAHVDLRTLVRLAIAQGLRAGATSQRGLLLNLGLQQILAYLPGLTDREALGQLVEPDGAGGQIAALFLIRGLDDYRPVGAVGRQDWPEPTFVPSLPPSQVELDFLKQWHEAFGNAAPPEAD
jgi:SAM-dependent MidA family methyltransferase